ncbi:MAG: fumarylacetoacetate hydrolase family protein [candidate division KSB1 bacterium]|nr:fumarylacetoacetate hydrolase family protein [candidate division KSB1 bacterium]MDZ7335699.1 fumarylacetoacetate hydrolase family protein [candidate division KSB1 bacterium]MDZ7358359.1 fumarylacetoacetate hydrolase family protein [candidate division KSB1 bacterium]MDZ7375408.1 fumarylacetoacetate hydrolase family protein [candidate division KSB1 bacterium]MDZ7401956.1 fumarylacetoacetate hydrolase family protein [candidate division KSB1 bacterium]
MKLFSFLNKDQLVRIGIELDGRKYDFSRIWEMFKDIRGKHHFPELSFLQVMIELELFNKENITEVIKTVSDLRPLDDLRIQAPIRFDVPIARPQKIICLGRNYRKHAEEFKNPVPKEPIIFAKMPSSLLAHEGTILLPKNVGRVDHEGELAVVIGKSGKYISESRAYEFVAGYTIVNDVTARELQIKDIENKLPWMRSKSFDTFCPIGPYLVPHGVIDNPHQLELTVTVNGAVRQKSNTSQFIFKVPEIIQFISRHLTLSPGDIIATGTPEGVAELKPGDVVIVEIDQIGRLQNYVAAE